MLEYDDKRTWADDGRKTERIRWLLFFVFLGITLLVGCALWFQRPSSNGIDPSPTASVLPSASPTAIVSPTAAPPVAAATPTANPTATTPAQTASPSKEDVQAIFSTMTLEDKIGQMMIAGFRGLTLSESPELSTLIASYYVGGIVLLKENAHDPQQIAHLISEAQDLAVQTGANIPLLVSINHEGGIVFRITEGATGFPGNMAIAASGKREYAYRAAALAANELRTMGFNMNLAPVLDVNDNPINPIIGVRSFGGSADLVADLGRETIKGFQENGIIAVGKHFPGHGSVGTDSHVGLPIINKSVSELLRVELPPFQMAIQEGVEAIMTAHIVVPAWESTPHLPATLSSAILTGLLREQMGFQGLIMTDSLGMGAIAAGRGQAPAAVEAVKAGADIVLSTGPLTDQMAIHQALVAAVQNGEIPESRIDASVRRILGVKLEYGLFEWEPATDLSSVGSDEHQSVADEMALAAITLLRDSAGLVPLPKDVRRLLVVSPNRLPPSDDGTETLLGQSLRQRGFEVTELVFNPDALASKETTFAEALAAVGEHDLIIFGEWGLLNRYANWSDQWQETLAAALQQSGKPVIMIAWRDPGAIIRLDQITSFLVAYGVTAGQVRAVAQVLAGEAPPRGILPIEIPTQY